METISIRQAKARFSRLVERVSAGEEIIIARAGKPVARLAPLARRAPRRLGRMKGRIWIAPDFDAPLPGDLLDLYNGEAKPKRKVRAR